MEGHFITIFLFRITQKYCYGVVFAVSSQGVELRGGVVCTFTGAPLYVLGAFCQKQKYINWWLFPSTKSPLFSLFVPLKWHKLKNSSGSTSFIRVLHNFKELHNNKYKQNSMLMKPTDFDLGCLIIQASIYSLCNQSLGIQFYHPVWVSVESIN